MNLAALPVMGATNEPETPFATHQHNSQRSTLVVVISSDGELLTSAPTMLTPKMDTHRTNKTIFCCIHLNTLTKSVMCY